MQCAIFQIGLIEFDLAKPQIHSLQLFTEVDGSGDRLQPLGARRLHGILQRRELLIVSGRVGHQALSRAVMDYQLAVEPWYNRLDRNERGERPMQESNSVARYSAGVFATSKYKIMESLGINV